MDHSRLDTAGLFGDTRDAGLEQPVERVRKKSCAAQRFAAAARTRVEAAFDHRVVLPKLESVYRGALERGRPVASHRSLEERSRINFN